MKFALNTIRQKVIILITAGLAFQIIVIILTAYLFENRILDATLEQEIQNSELINYQNATAISSQLIAAKDKLAILATNPIIQDPISDTTNPNNCSSLLADVLPEYNDSFSGISMVNDQGIFICMSQANLIGMDASKTPHVQRLLDTEGHPPVLGDVSQSIINPERQLVAMLYPVFDRQENFIGGVGGGIYVNEMKQKYLPKQSTFFGHSHTIVVDNHRHIIFDDQVIQAQIPESVNVYIDSLINRTEPPQDNHTYITAHQIETGFENLWWIVTYADKQTVQKAVAARSGIVSIRSSTILAAIILLTITGVTVLGFWSVSKNLLTPLDKLSNLIPTIGTRKFSKDKYLKQTTTRNDEIGAFA